MAFDAKVEILTEFTSDPDDPKATAKACFTAAIVYACFLGFCGCQVTKCYYLFFF
jgi:ribonuclease kappa